MQSQGVLFCTIKPEGDRYTCVDGQFTSDTVSDRNAFAERRITMEASVAIQSLPSVSDEDELCRIVDEVIAYIAGTGYNYYVGPFETTIEGPYDELMDIVKECQHIAIRAGAPSVAAYVKVSYKPEGEVLSIERKIGKYHS